MIDPSFFMDKSIEPRLSDIKELMPETYLYWEKLIAYVYANYPDIKEEWTHSGKKYGWSFRLRSKKRVVLYFTPLQHCVRIAFALGQAATDAVLIHPDVPVDLKQQLLEATPYPEGRGLRVMVDSEGLIPVIAEIIKIKMKN